MSADFKLCIKCDKLVNILDDHDDCYRHRVCNSEFPCEICKSWTSEKRQSVERMIDKARLAATKKQSRSTDVETCPSSSTSSPLTGTRQFVASSLLTRADNQNNQSLLTGTVTTQSPLTGTGAIQSPLVGTGTFQSNSPVGVGSVHDIHASNIDITLFILEEKIAMTAPVVIRLIPGPGPACESNFTMSFFMSNKVKNLPQPTESTVFLNHAPVFRAYVRYVLC